AFRSLQNDPVMYQANRDARAREGNPASTNPIFTGGALLFDGVLYKNIPEITQRLNLGLIGTASANVEPFFLCGQAALAYATGQMPRPTQLEDGDYDFVTGLGIEAQYGVGKIAKAPLTASGATVGDLVDWGMVTGFVATT
uniref:phage capsid family protein n=2 Tax=Nitrobacteraceae TaxID=41294 RepID=UPI0005762A71